MPKGMLEVPNHIHSLVECSSDLFMHWNKLFVIIRSINILSCCHKGYLKFSRMTDVRARQGDRIRNNECGSDESDLSSCVVLWPRMALHGWPCVDLLCFLINYIHRWSPTFRTLPKCQFDGWIFISPGRFSHFQDEVESFKAKWSKIEILRLEKKSYADHMSIAWNTWGLILQF